MNMIRWIDILRSEPAARKFATMRGFHSTARARGWVRVHLASLGRSKRFKSAAFDECDTRQRLTAEILLPQGDGWRYPPESVVIRELSLLNDVMYGLAVLAGSAFASLADWPYGGWLIDCRNLARSIYDAAKGRRGKIASIVRAETRRLFPFVGMDQ